MKVKRKIYFISFFLSLAIIFASVFLFYQIRYPIKYQEEIKVYSNKYGLNNDLVASIINEESSFKANSKSNKGAIGLMQILPSTAEYIAKSLLNEEYNLDKLLEPETNIRYGCCYLNYLKNKFEDERTLLCAYNAGETNVIKWLNDKNLSENGKKLDNIPYLATQIYVNKIMSGKKYYLKRI